ncbi:UNVERIFIED_CONTAM: hypothetical protein PYX00_007068 [Menopon gallinae]
MTKEAILRICKENKLYMTPRLNDVLYLHFKGYSKIENLEEYSGLKCLWLENNGIGKIENLDNQKELKSLYLHHNLIKEIENLEDACPLLDSLNLCHNSVSKIQNLSRLAFLHTLNISHNRLQDFADLEHLKDCKELSCLDISHNWIEDPTVVDIFEAMQSLRVLYLTGNPVIRKIPSYRKSLTVRCKMLTYLDDRPVFPKDRAAAEAWNVGGLEAERACRQKWAEEEHAKITESVRAVLSLRDKAKAEREAAKKIEELEIPENSDVNKEEESISSEESGEDFDDMEGGDSGNNRSNRIIFPWMYREEDERRRENSHGEGGRSLIIEISDTPNEECTAQKHVGKGYSNQETRDKLRVALQAAEWIHAEKTAEEAADKVDAEKSEAEKETLEEYLQDIIVDAVDKRINLETAFTDVEKDKEDTQINESVIIDGIKEEVEEVVDLVIESALDIVSEKEQRINVDEAHNILDNAIMMLDKLDSIGNFPLVQKPCSLEVETKDGEGEDIPSSRIPEKMEESDNTATEDKTETAEETVSSESLPDIEVEGYHETPPEEYSAIKVYEKNISKSLELQIIVDKEDAE